MKRWLAVYAVGFFAFLHLPLLTLAFFSFNSSRFTSLGAFFPGLVSRHLSRSAIDRSYLEQRDRRAISTVISTALGTMCAYGLWKTHRGC